MINFVVGFMLLGLFLLMNCIFNVSSDFTVPVLFLLAGCWWFTKALLIKFGKVKRNNQWGWSSLSNLINGISTLILGIFFLVLKKFSPLGIVPEIFFVIMLAILVVSTFIEGAARKKYEQS